eukprot:TRINITY_DN28020_c0_g1_i1.p1 TRINITY_DN28020_c0_g1~~TRINITY_DN28020_c0_g1_i1.p1  ORF type:complete len:223 (-),score=55.77 TRINITY_DN28020_c0_g1_i1:71-739(-)
MNQTEILVYHSWIGEYAKIADIILEDGKKKVMFQEPLTHAPVGEWIKSGDLRFLIFNNLAVLDMPGEYVCVEEAGEALFSYIPPSGLAAEIPVMSNLETILTLGANNVTLQGLSFQHSSYYGKDGYNFGNAAVKVFNSEGINIQNCQFAHTGMTGLSVANSDDVQVQQNVFMDMGYHGLLIKDSQPTRMSRFTITILMVWNQPVLGAILHVHHSGQYPDSEQ